MQTGDKVPEEADDLRLRLAVSKLVAFRQLKGEGYDPVSVAREYVVLTGEADRMKSAAYKRVLKGAKPERGTRVVTHASYLSIAEERARRMGRTQEQTRTAIQALDDIIRALSARYEAQRARRLKRVASKEAAFQALAGDRGVGADAELKRAALPDELRDYGFTVLQAWHRRAWEPNPALARRRDPYGPLLPAEIPADVEEGPTLPVFNLNPEERARLHELLLLLAGLDCYGEAAGDLETHFKIHDAFPSMNALAGRRPFGSVTRLAEWLEGEHPGALNPGSRARRQAYAYAVVHCRIAGDDELSLNRKEFVAALSSAFYKLREKRAR